MENLELNAKLRETTGKKVQSLREKGILPAVVYGHEVKPQNLELEYTAFEKIYQEAGENTLVDLKIDKQTFNQRIIEWAVQYGLQIDGDYLNIQKETVSDFIDELENQFVGWRKEETRRDNKM